jgi:hypothetical protein
VRGQEHAAPPDVLTTQRQNRSLKAQDHGQDGCLPRGEEAAPLGESGGACSLAAGAGGDGSLLTELVADRDVDGKEQLQTSNPPNLCAAIQDLFFCYSETVLSQVMQTAASNSLHSFWECSRLLTMHDRADGEKLTFAHEFLARIMGANRTWITLTAQNLKDEGIITYR